MVTIGRALPTYQDVLRRVARSGAYPYVAARVFKEAIERVSSEAGGSGIHGEGLAMGQFPEIAQFAKAIKAIGAEQPPRPEVIQQGYV